MGALLASFPIQYTHSLSSPPGYVLLLLSFLSTWGLLGSSLFRATEEFRRFNGPCTARWSMYGSFPANCLPQLWQLYMRLPWWRFKWILSVLFWAVAYSQNVHLKGFSPVKRKNYLNNLTNYSKKKLEKDCCGNIQS